MEQLVYICRPNLFHMVYPILLFTAFMLGIGFIVYKIQKPQKAFWMSWSALVCLFCLLDLALDYNTYQKAKDALKDPTQWHYVTGQIENYHHVAFKRENFTVGNRYFSNQSLIGGFNPSTGKAFVTIRSDVLKYHAPLQIAFVDTRNPIIMKICMTPHPASEGN